MKQRGFTLLEMMIAMAILSGSLTWLIVGMSRNIKAENHAKLMTTATFLARDRMIQFEDELYEKGFGEFDKEQTGTFDEKGFSRFGWHLIVDKVTLPDSTQLQTAMTKAQEARQTLTGQPAPTDTSGSSSSSSSQSPLTQSAGAMASQFGIIKDVLEGGIRRVTMEVTWWEGRMPQSVSVVCFYTDVRKVDQAINLSLPANLPGAGGGGCSAKGSSCSATSPCPAGCSCNGGTCG
jgi:prepilin-type N-terminal cleavage/methylation domain-containing protein